jgi:hypothetical protein
LENSKDRQKSIIYATINIQVNITGLTLKISERKAKIYSTVLAPI